jgi:anti-sigma factor RsiW
MSKKLNEQTNIGCRQARKRFAEWDGDAALERHLQSCPRCAMEYRLFGLQRAALELAATPEPVAPDEDFFRALWARIARGPQVSLSRPAEESWTAALLLTARQLVPAMAVLLLVILGATLLWNQPAHDTSQAAMRPRERVMFSDIYDYPAPTRDDVLETLVAVEEKQNGK